MRRSQLTATTTTINNSIKQSTITNNNSSSQITLDDCFRPASFYLSHASNKSASSLSGGVGGGGVGSHANYDNNHIHNNDGEDDDSSESDLVSPPPVPSSPPPMEEVLGGYNNHHSFSSSSLMHHHKLSNSSVGVEISDISDILSSAKSTLRHNRTSTGDNLSLLEEKNRRTSTGSRTSYNSATQSHSSLQSLSTNRESTMSPHKLMMQGLNLQGSQQSLNRDSNMSPHRILNGSQQSLGSRDLPHGSHQSLGSRELPHGSHQSLGSRELPPLPGQSYLGSQQSLASREVQQIGTKDIIDPLHYSPFHSREGSLDNEAFLYHRFTQGSSLADPYNKKAGSSDELSSDTAMYEQEFRRYHLENIQEVSNTLERDEVRKSVISQNLNISYNSVYDLKSQQTKFRIQEEQQQSLNKQQQMNQHHGRQRTKSGSNPEQDQGHLSPRSKIPYYVSELMEGEIDHTNNDNNVVDAITKSMKALDVESNSYFQSKNEAENERIRKLRRSYTPDPYLNRSQQATPQQPLINQQQSEIGLQSTTQQQPQGVGRSRSLEGLLGDSQGSVKDNLGYKTSATATGQQQQLPKVYSPHNFNDITVEPRPARGVQPPPPPEGVPPLDIPQGEGEGEEDDGTWADTLRYGVW